MTFEMPPTCVRGKQTERDQFDDRWPVIKCPSPVREREREEVMGAMDM